MATVLKLNAISPVADQVFPAGYNYTDKAENPDGIMVRSAAMNDYDFRPIPPSLQSPAQAQA